MGTFHEVLPGNLVFFHFYYIGTKEIEYLNHNTALNWKKYLSSGNFKSRIQNLSLASRDQTVNQLVKKDNGSIALL